MAQLENSDIQGFALSSYSKNMPCASYYLLKITDPEKCRRWLKGLLNEITTGLDRKEDFCQNIAFTATGLAKFGFTEGELGSFSAPFQEGMITSTRQQILGDYRGSAPQNWSWGNASKPVDVLLLLFARDENMLAERHRKITTQIQSNGGVELIVSLSAGRQPDSREHFGFFDGVGQPVIEGTEQRSRQLKRTGHATEIKAGEFILGYENEMQKIDSVPTRKIMENFGRNGTYLVFRQLEQHVAVFWNYLKNTTSKNGEEGSIQKQESLAAKIIGRWKSGAPVTLHPLCDPTSPSETPQENNFTYAEFDKDGLHCPVGAHIRRTNPRDSLLDDGSLSLLTVNRHRIIRRGRSYGDRLLDVYNDDKKERGLHFICINSNIERQFEFIQQTWVNNQTFGGLNSELDPLIGHRETSDTFTIPGCPARTRIHGLEDFVTTKGGAYFFMPGIEALRNLTQ
ncbi:Dyp-type peroxidase [Dyadobacter sp. CY323]|uniref:Dyp-type peroxidase n=1 Tax=Dyadobacter sp. CY323 TaxID=2907302 RepID=UPI001F1BA3B2|nr:Dyp-type peroxidase [Dyadobacter sp. CY323]MCE6989811.1 Dyp-type peroxidase [Dyadobacter sp. CY323]